MRTGDQKISEAVQREWIKAEKMALVHASQSVADAETWLRNHSCWNHTFRDLLFIIRLPGTANATEITKRTKRVWQKIFRHAPESFPNTIQMWLLVLGNPKNPDAPHLFYFVRGVEWVSSGILKNHLREEFKNVRTLRFSTLAFNRVAKWFCSLCSQGKLVAFVPIEFHARYRRSWRLREIR